MNASVRGSGLPAERSLSEEWSAPSFQESLDEWMQHTPWLFLSLAAHLIVFFIIAAIPWKELREPDPRIIHITEALVPPETIPDLPPEPPIDTEDPIEEPPEPELQTVEAVEQPSESPSDDPDASPFEDNPLESEPFLAEIGISGAPSEGKYSVRNEGGPGGRHGPAMSVSLRRGLAWLAAHQSPDGAWDADGFEARCGEIGASLCSGAGYPEHDVGVSSLALLAFLGSGSSTARGEHKHEIRRGVAWLVSQQDPDTGLVGARTLAALSHLLGDVPDVRHTGQNDQTCSWRIEKDAIGSRLFAASPVELRCRLPLDGADRTADSCTAKATD